MFKVQRRIICLLCKFLGNPSVLSPPGLTLLLLLFLLLFFYCYLLSFLFVLSSYVSPLFSMTGLPYLTTFPIVGTQTNPYPWTPPPPLDLGSGFLFLSQSLEQESHGRPLQADALQFVLQLVLQAAQPHRGMDQDHCEEEVQSVTVSWGHPTQSVALIIQTTGLH